jgi:hypothetical protein
MSWTGDCKKLLQQLKKSPNAVYFLDPVDWKSLGLRDYPQIIKNPMDLGTMGSKLASNQYTSFADFQAEFYLVVSNCKTYNAEGSEVYNMAEQLAGEYEKFKARLWPDEAKRVLNILKKNANAYIFLEPVDWKTLGLADYLKIVKNPMDLGTVSTKLASDQYASIDAFYDDVNLIWTNCMLYNADGSEVYNMAAAMLAETAKLTAGAPALAAPTPAASAVGVPAPKRRKSQAQPEPEEDVDMEDDEAEKRREDIVRMGKRFAALRHDYLGGAIRFIYAKCPKAVKLVEAGQYEIDFQNVSDDPSCCDSINQLIKVMLYLQQNPE